MCAPVGTSHCVADVGTDEGLEHEAYEWSETEAVLHCVRGGGTYGLGMFCIAMFRTSEPFPALHASSQKSADLWQTWAHVSLLLHEVSRTSYPFPKP